MKQGVSKAGVLLLLVVVAVACATTGLGKAIQTADVQKKLVERGTIEFMKLHYQQRVSDADYATGRALYAKWYAAEVLVAESLARWKVSGSEANGSALEKALSAWTPLAQQYLDFIGRFVDLKKLGEKLKGGA